ncbi:AAA family ATPase [Ohessyouella blattaphilus]|uniref:AAA family ATPase n=1 Tax=Ohessyouella blattaphilus TaxID=2949333 RepID=A0ABT1EHT2_9FIRM|nr:AAA family ATPase [Ohessyouella blattaphilus]MCP1110259.1 AAA family ATPase [Ohessyouella blattaphilus]MCR8563653.1 AAA family ATPase [Ohessyouella blattaphilus]
MKIASVHIQNFRKLLKCNIDFSKETTLFVGANNSGKTSAMDSLGKFLAGRGFVFNDITVSNRTAINAIGSGWEEPECEMPEDVIQFEPVMPQMDIWLEVLPNEIHYVANIIPTLKWPGGKLGIRLALLPRDITQLFVDYREAYSAARMTEMAKPSGSTTINLFPKDLCEFVERKLTTYFAIKSYILDPAKYEIELPQPTSFEMECFTDNPLKGIIRVDIISAQRGFTDPDVSGGEDKGGRQLSAQMRSYYDKHLDPEKAPLPEDLEILEVTEAARKAFDKNLEDKFAPAIQELERLGYPGVADPKITLATKVNTSETLRHDSAIQYALSKNDETLKLPEKYNGLGYQNLISMVFDLMRFRDDWMREGKAKQAHEDTNVVIEPLHLVLVEEPEAHLHMQVQQVFIRKAYSVLKNHVFLKKNPNFSTQLVISTHSSHIAREVDFADLRYFKRLSESVEYNVATAKVINLSEVFGKESETSKFVTRYLQTTHCDLFFADAAILVEGSAESMLLPHFIRNEYPELYQRYISILNINGKHSHRLSPLIEKLCLPTLVIADLDAAEKDGHHKAARPQRNKELISGNYSITKWLIKEIKLDELLDIPIESKVFAYATPYAHAIRIAYQTPVMIDFNGSLVEALSSTFEDCLVYTNYELFKNIKTTDKGSLVKNVHDSIAESDSFDDVHEKIYKLLREGKSDQKAEFALDVIYDIDPKEITIPSYIAEGLEWLQSLLRPEGEVNV